MDAQRRRTAKLVKRLRDALDSRDLTTFDQELETAKSPDLLTALREQKLMLKAPAADRPRVAEAMRACAFAVLERDAAETFDRYLCFVDVWIRAHDHAMARLTGLLQPPIQLDQPKLLGLLDEALQAFVDALPTRPDPQGLSVAEYERQLHGIYGLANDTAYAAMRALNEAVRLSGPCSTGRIVGPDQRRPIVRRLQAAIQAAGDVNALETALDWVTYGDLEVSVVGAQSPAIVRLDFADPRRSLLRTLAIRRDMVLNLNGARAARVVRDMLKSSEQAMLAEAVAFYAEPAGVDEADINVPALLAQSAAALIHLNAEDDLLLFAAGQRSIVTAYYFAAAALQNFHLAAAAVRQAAPASIRPNLAAPAIPVDWIEMGLQGGADGEIARALEALSCQLPARSHFDLIRRPYVRTPNGATHDLPFGAGGLWATTVRETLIAGGDLGDAYGRMWEDFFAFGFQETDWTVLGRGLKLRRGGRLATDLDLLLKRGELLLVVQVKALVGSGATIYDHWRNRQTIEWGCRQAAEAMAFITAEPDWLVSVAGRKVAETVRHIQPLVLTTLDTFDGWRFEGVPVIGEVGRKAITEGAKVTYSDGAGNLVHTRWITRPEDLTTERILWSLDNPVELLIAPELPETLHRTVSVPGLTVELPEFVLRPDSGRHPARRERNEFAAAD